MWWWQWRYKVCFFFYDDNITSTFNLLLVEPFFNALVDEDFLDPSIYGKEHDEIYNLEVKANEVDETLNMKFKEY